MEWYYKRYEDFGASFIGCISDIYIYDEDTVEISLWMHVDDRAEYQSIYSALFGGSNTSGEQYKTRVNDRDLFPVLCYIHRL